MSSLSSYLPGVDFLSSPSLRLGILGTDAGKDVGLVPGEVKCISSEFIVMDLSPPVVGTGS